MVLPWNFLGMSEVLGRALHEVQHNLTLPGHQGWKAPHSSGCSGSMFSTSRASPYFLQATHFQTPCGQENRWKLAEILKVSNHYKYHLINYLTSQYFMMLIEIQRKPSQGVTNHLLSFLPLSLKASLARAGPLAPLWPKGSAFRR